MSSLVVLSSNSHDNEHDHAILHAPPPKPTHVLYHAERIVHNVFGLKHDRPSIFQTGNWTPVQEEQTLTITGAKVPVDLHGVFFRIGPNPLLPALGPFSWFDGDGMVHAVRLGNTSATYSNRFVHTQRYQQELRYGWPLFPRVRTPL